MHLRIRGIYIVMTEILCLVVLMGLFLIRSESEQALEVTSSSGSEKKYIKWVEFNVTYQALCDAYEYDVKTHGTEVELKWIELLAYLGAKYGGDFRKYKEKDMDKVAECLLSQKETIKSLTERMEYYSYYYEAYEAVLGGLVGEYEIQTYAPTPSVTVTPAPGSDSAVTVLPEILSPTKVTGVLESPSPSAVSITITPKPKEEPPEMVWEQRYGLKGFSPIAREYYYHDFDDFGVSRSYGYKRRHLGHDMMGSVGTPVIAVESGYIEALGWNQYGGWRIGIRSFDGKRYYYYAHLRKNFPYNRSLVVGSIVTAGDVIGYLGRTGYSKTENVNNIQTSHLHFGLQLIFDESQKEGNNEIWVDCYALTKFLYKNRSLTVKDIETKEYSRFFSMKDPAVTEYKNQQEKEKEEPLDGQSQDGILIEYE